MVRRTLARAVSEKTGIPAKTILQALDGTLEVWLAELARTGSLEWRGLGTFTVRTYPARKIHNPATGKVIQLPARKAVTFKPGRSIKATLAAGRASITKRRRVR